MSKSSFRNLISTQSLNSLLQSEDKVVLLDIRYMPGQTDGYQRYLAGHIVGALPLDLARQLADGAAVGRGSAPLPNPASLQSDLHSLGVNDDSTIVVYDDTNGAPAARAWWVLRWAGLQSVLVLDGGLAAWRQDGFAIDRQIVSPSGGGNVTVRVGALPHVTIDDVDAADRLLLDARGKAAFVAGRIPHAQSLPAATLQKADGRLLPHDELRRRLIASGIEPGREAIATCGGGVAASYLVLAAEEAGLQLALHAGSFSEWTEAGKPVATGEPSVAASSREVV